MFARLRPLYQRYSLHTHAFSRIPHLQTRFSSNKTSDSLRVLFCGSDDFSISSLRALHTEKATGSGVISSIDVLCKPPQRSGRGLKLRLDSPLKTAALELSLPVHEVTGLDTWTPPERPEGPINLIITASFGEFIPKTLLEKTQYGGINVHPSLLPDLRGPAPIHHTLLKNRTSTGVSIQIMHPEKFDRGTILLQTPPPGIQIPENSSAKELQTLLSPIAANMLIEALQSRAFVPPLEDMGWWRGISYAPKITKNDSYINWAKWTAEEILRRHRVLGNLQSSMDPNTPSPSRSREKLFHDPASKSSTAIITFNSLIEPPPFEGERAAERIGKLISDPGVIHIFENKAYITTCGKTAKLLRIMECSIAGRKTGAGLKYLTERARQNA